MELVDRILVPLLEAPDEERRRSLIEEIIARDAEPVIDTILARKLDADDAADIRSEVIIRILKALSVAQTPIENFRDYVAGSTYHAFHDYLRAKYPERARLKNRLRYVLTHSPDFELWPNGVCALAGDSHGAGADAEAVLDTAKLPSAAYQADDPVRAVRALLEAAGRPLEFDSFVSVVARLWKKRTPTRAMQRTEERVETRQFLERLWSEICDLRPRQRTALLLHLRDAAGDSALPLFAMLGIAGVRKVAEVLALEASEVAAFWNELPFDDLRIAGLLGVTRQQVINLRRSARERLMRRMK